MNLRDLKYLITLAETQHFGQAAERCFISQPTLSMQLKKLEEELGLQVFERTSKQIFVTPVGEEIIAKARQILQGVDELKLIAKQAEDPFAGIMRLGIIPSVAPYLLPRILPNIQKKLPQLELILHEDKTEALKNSLLAGELDAIIIALPLLNNELSAHGLHAEFLYREEFYIALAKAHHLAKKKVLSLKDIEKETLLLLSEGHCLRDQALAVCKQQGLKQHPAFQATSLETLRQMVIAGQGITLLPELALMKHDGLVTRPISVAKPYREIALVYRKSKPRQICCTRLAQIIKQVF